MIKKLIFIVYGLFGLFLFSACNFASEPDPTPVSSATPQAAVENKVAVHDLHATLLHLLGFDHEKLTYRYAGRDFRLTDVQGRVVQELLA